MGEAPILLPIESIYVADDKMPFPFDAEGSAAIGQQIEAVGQLAAITVRRRANAETGRRDKPFELIDGRRRLEGMRGTGRTEIAATLIVCSKNDVRRLSVEANLHRRVLTTIELAIVIGESRGCAIIAQDGWAARVAATIRRSVRTVYNHLKLFEKLIAPFPELLPELCAHPISDSYMVLAGIAEENREGFRRDALVRAIRNIGQETPGASLPKQKRRWADDVPNNWSKTPGAEQRQHADAFGEATKHKVRPAIVAGQFRYAKNDTRREIFEHLCAEFPDDCDELVDQFLAALPRPKRDQIISKHWHGGGAA